MKTWLELGVEPGGMLEYWSDYFCPRGLACYDRLRLWLCIDELERLGKIPTNCEPGVTGPIPKGNDAARRADWDRWHQFRKAEAAKRRRSAA